MAGCAITYLHRNLFVSRHLKTWVCVPIHCQWPPRCFTAGSRVHGKENIAFFAGLSGKQVFDLLDV